jgi:hypothetical protein
MATAHSLIWQEHEQETKALARALADFSAGLTQPWRLKELNDELSRQKLSTLLEYYSARPELAHYTIEQERSPFAPSP